MGKMHVLRHEGKIVKAIGIDDESPLRCIFFLEFLKSRKEIGECQTSAGVGTQTRSHGYCIVSRKVGRKRGEESIVIVDREHCLWHSCLHDVNAAARNMDGEKADTRAETGARSKHSSTHFAKRTSNKECMTIVAFMAIRIAGIEEREHL